MWFQAWCRTIKDNASGLDATLLVRNNLQDKNKQKRVAYTVNFDPNLLRLTREAQFLSRLEFVLPSLASKVLVQAKRLKEYRDQLTHLLGEWNSVRRIGAREDHLFRYSLT